MRPTHACAPLPTGVSRFTLVGRALRECTAGVYEYENRVTQGFSACGVGDPDEPP